MHQLFKKLNMKRIVTAVMAVVLMMVLCVPCAAAGASHFGTCGSGVEWSYADGTLTISGTGAMKNYSEARPAPWKKITEEIRVVTVQSGVTAIGNLAFYECDSITKVTLPDTVNSIGQYAFANCTKLKTVNLGGKVSEIGDSAFERCESLQAIRLPDTLTEIGKRAFYRCESLKAVTVPASVQTIGDMAFTYASSLVTAEVHAHLSELPMWSFYGCELMTNLTLGATVTSLGDNALYRCDSLTAIYHLGDESAKAGLLNDIRASLPTFRDASLVFAPKNKTTSTSVEEKLEDNILTTDTVTVQSGENSMIATTVTQKNAVTADGKKAERLSSSVTIEAVIENESGWGELTEEIIKVERESDAGANIGVAVSVNGSAEISGEIFSGLAGKNVDIEIDTPDGSGVKIDCEKLEPTVAEQKLEFTYQLKRISQPTEDQYDVFGSADSYLLEFTSNTALKYSPRIYLGTLNMHKCAVLYQQFRGSKIERVQSAIIDKEGYATFYLEKTLSSVQYFIAIDVQGERYSDAIIPDELAVDSGEIEMYEPIT
ncbi:MAG: leucine-rich repeat domain-containing protein, partial [Clostridia bacterium]|nr:leucine-rich repeat domain-containing protein [Clostridia bacterium]